MSKKGEGIERLVVDLRAVGVPEPEREYKFAIGRRFRFDLAWPSEFLAVEVDGGTWVGGRHTTGAGFERDAHKLNLAVLCGWRVLRYTTSMIREGGAADEIRSAFQP